MRSRDFSHPSPAVRRAPRLSLRHGLRLLGCVGALGLVMGCSAPPDVAARGTPIPKDTPWPKLLTSAQLTALEAEARTSQVPVNLEAEAEALAARVRALKARAVALQNTSI